MLCKYLVCFAKNKQQEGFAVLAVLEYLLRTKHVLCTQNSNCNNTKESWIERVTCLVSKKNLGFAKLTEQILFSKHQS
jgi:hypothetical protein